MKITINGKVPKDALNSILEKQMKKGETNEIKSIS